ncbi:unnamed protein product [Closterium sp. NIES-65]|nr:unnamed protein product [Closterium sp. NIES-65]
MKRVGRGEGRGREAAIRSAPRICFSARTAVVDSSRGDLSRGGFVATAAAAETGGRAAGCDSIERIAELIRRTHAPERYAHGSAGRGEGTAERGSAVVHEGHAEEPLRSLDAGRWVKLICGASFEDVADVRNLTFIYTLRANTPCCRSPSSPRLLRLSPPRPHHTRTYSGGMLMRYVDCIDCAADTAVVAAACLNLSISHVSPSLSPYPYPHPILSPSGLHRLCGGHSSGGGSMSQPIHLPRIALIIPLSLPPPHSFPQWTASTVRRTQQWWRQHVSTYPSPTYRPHYPLILTPTPFFPPVDCIDCAAEPAVVAAARDGINAATAWAACTLMDGRVYGGEAPAAQRDGRVGEAVGQLRGGSGGEVAGEGVGDGRAGGGNGEGGRRPWVMVSVSDGQDPHFRKAVFDASVCPPTCPRPCERVCPAAAIRFPPTATDAGPTAAQASMAGSSSSAGVIAERCYGCGRCIPVCPLALISAEEHQRTEEDTLNLLRSGIGVLVHLSALPLPPLFDLIPTSARSTSPPPLTSIFVPLSHSPCLLPHYPCILPLFPPSLSSCPPSFVSLPDLGDSMPAAMHAMHRTMLPHLSAANLWQLDGRPMGEAIGAGAAHAALDGRPMSGDIGAGATRAAVRLAARVAAFQDRPPGCSHVGLIVLHLSPLKPVSSLTPVILVSCFAARSAFPLCHPPHEQVTCR